MENRLAMRTARTVIVEAVPARRMLLADILRGLGFATIATLNKPQELIGHLKASPSDWIIMPLSSDHQVNGIHILKTITMYPALHHIHVSMLFSPEERVHIPLAFELGLLSSHSTTYNRESMSRGIDSLFRRITTHKQDMTLVAADYLRQDLIELRLPKARLELEQALNEMYVGEPEIMLNLAQAQMALGDNEVALTTLSHVELLNKSLKPQLDLLRHKCKPAPTLLADVGDALDDEFAEVSFEEKAAPLNSNTKTNLLGLDRVVIIDNDASTPYILETLLKEAGVPNVNSFADGSEAWEWLKTQQEPSLIIMEWSLPGITGPLLLQRVRQKGFLQVPVVVVSSLIKPSDAPLILEMGVSGTIEKPLEKKAFFKAMIAALQQGRRPTEQLSLERKVRQLLASGNHAEARRLSVQYRSDARIPASAQKHLEAEFLYAHQQYEEACELASKALRESQDSLPLLNLLGKCLLKLGRHQIALKCFARAQEISPDNIERLCRMAEAQQVSGDEAGSDKSMAAAIALDPGADIVRETSTKLALDKGDVEKATQLMQHLESLQGILAFMNNRAVALTRSGQFEKGINLYRNTLTSLPGEWSQIHDAITYNLGLAHAKYGEIGDAIQALLGMSKTPDVTLKRKRDSLLSRLEEAKKNGGALQLQESAPQTTSKEFNKANPVAEMLATVELSRGDICCYLLFRAFEAVGPATIQLLAQMPSFGKRSEADDDGNGLNFSRKQSAS